MSGPPLALEPLDIAMLRAMYREGGISFAGFDPRLNANRVAQALHIGRARVAARLRLWRQSGFLSHYSVLVNPRLLGLIGGSVAIRCGSAKERSEMLSRLKLVDGVISAVEFLGNWVSVEVLAPDETTLKRRRDLLRSLCTSAAPQVDPLFLWNIPRPTRELTPLDLRIVRALRDRPTASLAEMAHRVGISTRTMTRRYAALLDDWAVWFSPVFNLRALVNPIVWIEATVEDDRAKANLTRALQAEYPNSIPMVQMPNASDPSVNWVLLITALPSIARLDDLEEFLASQPGLLEHETLVMVTMHDFPEWFDTHLKGFLSPPRKPVERDR
ncbi:MAG: Lrp/AsnC family transcriptional regulator [Nitrososphaerota archaeon]|jgi:DNA-binding Lrp family transcriptional regulator|nr:Lrp/AsnC family transcriptional regulator [Nitrososphaerota archaeon]